MDNKDVEKSIEWIFRKLRKPPILWHLASSLTIATVGFLSKVITGNCIAAHFIRKKILLFISSFFVRISNVLNASNTLESEKEKTKTKRIGETKCKKMKVSLNICMKVFGTFQL